MKEMRTKVQLACITIYQQDDWLINNRSTLADKLLGFQCMLKMANEALYAGMAHVILLHIAIVCNVHSCGHSFDSACYIDAHKINVDFVVC